MSDSNGHGSPNATIRDVAAHFGVTPRTVQRWVSNGDIPHHKIGGALRFDLREVMEASRRRTPVVVP